MDTERFDQIAAAMVTTASRRQVLGGVLGSVSALLLHEGSLAHAECRTEREIEAGDHVVLIGLVVGGKPPSAVDVPLVSYGRQVRGWPEP